MPFVKQGGGSMVLWTFVERPLQLLRLHGSELMDSTSKVKMSRYGDNNPKCLDKLIDFIEAAAHGIC